MGRGTLYCYPCGFRYLSCVARDNSAATAILVSTFHLPPSAEYTAANSLHPSEAKFLQTSPDMAVGERGFLRRIRHAGSSLMVADESSCKVRSVGWLENAKVAWAGRTLSSLQASLGCVERLLSTRDLYSRRDTAPLPCFRAPWYPMPLHILSIQ